MRFSPRQRVLSAEAFVPCLSGGRKEAQEPQTILCLMRILAAKRLH